MNEFDFRKSVRDAILLREGWEEKLAQLEKEDGEKGEENSTSFGLNSQENDESLINMLEKSTLTHEQQVEVVGLMMQLADKHGVVLEQNLIGLRSEKDRIIPAQAIVGLMNNMKLSGAQKRNLAQILDKWGKFNSVRFDARGADTRPSDPTSLDNIDRKKASPRNTADDRSSLTGEEAEDEEEWERGETEEIPKRKSANEVDVCAGLLDSLKKADPKLFAAMEDDDTIRGAVANFSNDLSFSADAVVLSALGAAAAIPPAAPFFGAIAAGAETVARSGAAVAVAMDLMLLNSKDALIDSIGLIPWGKWVGKALGKAGKAATKAGERASGEAAQKFLKTAGKGAQTAAESGIKNLEKTLAEKLLQAAPGLGAVGAQNAAKAIRVAVEQRIQSKLKSGGYGKDAPNPNKYEDPKKYKRALKKWQQARQAAIEGEYKNCFRKDNVEIKNRALNFIEAANNYVDDFPDAFDAIIGKGVDAVKWAKNFIFGDDPTDPPPALSAKPTSQDLNEQRYIYLLRRFKINENNK